MKYTLRLFQKLLKKQWRNPFYLSLLILFPLLCLCIDSQIRQTSEKSLLVFVASEGSDSFTEQILSDLTNQTGRAAFVRTEKDELIPRLIEGNADCGYLFPEDLSERLLEGNLTDAITLYLPDKSEFSAFTNEIVHAAIFHRLSPYYAAHFLKSQEHYTHLLPRVDQEFPIIYKKIARLYENSSIRIQTIEGEMFDTQSQNHLLFPLKGIVGLFLSGLLFFSGASWKKQKEQGKMNGMPLPIRRSFFFCQLLASYLPASVSCMLAMYLCETGSVGENMLSLLWYFPILCLFCFLMLQLSGNYQTFLSFLPLYLLSECVLTPVFWNLGSIVPIVRILEKFFPVFYFLQ